MVVDFGLQIDQEVMSLLSVFFHCIFLDQRGTDLSSPLVETTLVVELHAVPVSEIEVSRKNALEIIGRHLGVVQFRSNFEDLVF